MAKKAKVSEEISEAKIRNAIWYLEKNKKTKKFVCEFLGINYNTKKLDNIIQKFKDDQEREKRLKEAARKKIFTQKEKEAIAKEYLSGDAQSTIAKRHYISAQRVKKILIETNTPIRGRGKNKAGQTDHIVQDLETKFAEGDKVFIAKYNCFGIIDFVFDEDYLDTLENGRQRYVETCPFKPDKNGLSGGRHLEPVEGIHYEIYWELENGSYMKLRAVESLRKKVINTLEETGREYYRVWRDDDSKCFHYVHRTELFPVKAY